uniref:Uncharacterized protein n=1 Tax=Zooxanthella nutricula TaxID=1333877 RepID=A0A7S2P747_9DINO
MCCKRVESAADVTDFEWACFKRYGGIPGVNPSMYDCYGPGRGNPGYHACGHVKEYYERLPHPHYEDFEEWQLVDYGDFAGRIKRDYNHKAVRLTGRQPHM